MAILPFIETTLAELTLTCTVRMQHERVVMLDAVLRQSLKMPARLAYLAGDLYAGVIDQRDAVVGWSIVDAIVAFEDFSPSPLLEENHG